MTKRWLVIYVEQPASASSYPIIVDAASRKLAEDFAKRLVKKHHGLHLGSDIKVISGYDIERLEWSSRLDGDSE